MVPVGLTITGLLTDAATVVSEFDGLILLVTAFIVGVWAVRFIPSAIRKAIRG